MSETHDFLGLPGIRTTGRRQTDTGIEVEAETLDPRFQQCCLLPDLVMEGSRSRRRIINDTMHGGLPTAILMKVRRARCKACGKRGIYEIIPHVRESRHMTDRLFDVIAREALLRPNTRVGYEAGVSEGTARSVLKEFIDGQLKDLRIQTPRVLGIDEKHLMGAYRAIIGNVEERTVVDLLPDREHAMWQYLKEMPEAERVEIVVADMFPAYFEAQRKLFPNAQHVVDKFHVVKRANLAMDKVRMAVMTVADGQQRAQLRNSKRLFGMRGPNLDDWAHEKIHRWGQLFPVLSQAYFAKERYFAMYEFCNTPAEAEAHYKHWRKTLPSEIRVTFEKYCKITPFWANSIYAYFEHRYTTGYIESVNRVLDDIQRAGRGYSFETIRGKLLLTPKLQKRTFRDPTAGMKVFMATDFPPPIETNLGADLVELDLMLNDGWLYYDEAGEARIRTGATTIHALGLGVD